jgi:Ser/Thr protein kinase RdoA (MazF antagonist)
MKRSRDFEADEMREFYRLTPAEQSERMRALGRAALERWDVVPREVALVKFRENAVFEVTCDGGRRYALRIHRAGYHSDAELLSELQWMQALGRDGFDVPELVPTRSGELFARVSYAGVPEPRQVDLFAWVGGRPLGSVASSLAGDALVLARTFHTVGTLAARLHEHAAGWAQPAGFTRHAWDAEGLVGERPFWGRFWELEALSAAERALLLRARDRMRLELGALERSAPSYGLIHADFAPENLLVDGERVRVLDFDDAGFGWRLFEIATSLYFHIGEPYFEAIRAALIEGYRSRRALPEMELARLPLFFAARGCTYLGWVHTRSETETARELTPMLIESACRAVREYLGSRQASAAGGSDGGCSGVSQSPAASRGCGIPAPASG